MKILANSSIGFEIIHKEDDFLVINKPANLTVHPNYLKQNNTLANALVFQFPKIVQVGENPLRPGIVHRLDKDTSGLMIIAKSDNGFKYFKKQFQDKKIEKKYLALVAGNPKNDQGIITKAISQSKKRYNKRSTLLESKSKKAETRYVVLKRYGDYSLIEAMPLTGRTHQIRIHLASIGHPIAGDAQYGFKRQINPRNLKRQFLHAYYLKFTSPSGKMMEFKNDLPEDLASVLEVLES